jgi:hypothetical protein
MTKLTKLTKLCMPRMVLLLAPEKTARLPEPAIRRHFPWNLSRPKSRRTCLPDCAYGFEDTHERFHVLQTHAGDCARMPFEDSFSWDTYVRLNRVLALRLTLSGTGAY